MSDKTPFFVGYLPAPAGLRRFLSLTAVTLILMAAAFGFSVAATQDDPGDAALRFDYGRQTVTGVIELTPTPVLRVTGGNDRIPEGRTLMMSGQGKNGTHARARPLNGLLVQASGVLLERGDLTMLQLRGGRNGLQAADGDAPLLPEAEPLGRWRLTGEICDGKCTAGAMRPGRGISHRACANLCLLGGVPAVFVSTQPIEGAEFLMIAGTADNVMPAALYDWVARYVTLEGEVTRIGDLLVLDVAPETVEAAQ